ncbi:MAG TPA: hypothetical protein ENG78_03705 [Acidiferrobacteraceae bacterium]|nr:hypothetical protein [Acidiferrobacteraceae bacterium]HEX19907.1 hypothetical protein [Acidiferrobacteraceae bacterium]
MDDLEQRIQNLEQEVVRLSAHTGGFSTDNLLFRHPAWPAALALAAIVSGVFGLGLPQHYYQPLFAVLALVLAYHRRFWVLPQNHWRWPLLLLNFVLLSLCFKLLIGGGITYPLDWLKTPILTKTPLPADSSWYENVIPKFKLEWQAIPDVSNWSLNLSKVQALLLLATLGGALFRFQPFASYVALVLLIASIPSLIQFHWDWVVIFLILTGITFYIQSNLKLTSLRRKPETDETTESSSTDSDR